jgi:hypothetical protein
MTKKPVMKSFLFCTSYINNEISGQHSLRYKKWIEYYSSIKKELGVEYIFVIDDGSAIQDLAMGDEIGLINMDRGLPARLSKKINILTFRDHLGRQVQNYAAYPGWWRSFTYSVKIADKYGFKKIVHIESDFYVISQRLRDFLKRLKCGWTALYSSFYHFPETAIQIICQDCFALLIEICAKAESSKYEFDRVAEEVLPFTSVIRHFRGDRIWEPQVLNDWVSGLIETEDPDYFGQLPTIIRPLSGAEFNEFIRQLKVEKNSNPDLTVNHVLEMLAVRNAVLKL